MKTILSPDQFLLRSCDDLQVLTAFSLRSPRLSRTWLDVVRTWPSVMGVLVVSSPLHTKPKPRRPRCVMNFFRERSEDVVKIGIFGITMIFLRSWYVPCRFLLRQPRSHQVIITRTATRALRPLRLNCTLNTFFLRLERPFYACTTHLSRSDCV
jgi:hypothetical protein